MSRPPVTINEMALDIKNIITNACAMKGWRDSVMLHCHEKQAEAFVSKFGGELETLEDGRKCIFWRGVTIYLIPYDVVDGILVEKEMENHRHALQCIRKWGSEIK